MIDRQRLAMKEARRSRGPRRPPSRRRRRRRRPPPPPTSTPPLQQPPSLGPPLMCQKSGGLRRLSAWRRTKRPQAKGLRWTATAWLRRRPSSTLAPHRRHLALSRRGKSTTFGFFISMALGFWWCGKCTSVPKCGGLAKAARALECQQRVSPCCGQPCRVMRCRGRVASKSKDA